MADTVAVAQLAVNADAAIELSPNISASRGLAPTPVTDQDMIRAAADGKQSFYFQADVPGAMFAAERALRPRDTTAEVDTQLTIDWQRLQVTQVIAYDVKYQPLAELSLELPDGWSIVGDQIAISSVRPRRRDKSCSRTDRARPTCSHRRGPCCRNHVSGSSKSAPRIRSMNRLVRFNSARINCRCPGRRPHASSPIASR